MNEEAAFRAAIRAEPADDTPRLVFADWLDEHDVAGEVCKLCPTHGADGWPLLPARSRRESLAR
jgi:uncharacterized protein (TIGR02996 family)